MYQLAIEGFPIPGPITVLPATLLDDPWNSNSYSAWWHTFKYLDAIRSGSPFGIMIRPCPQHPRHGFVESRIVETPTLRELIQVIEATAAADPAGEVLVMPFAPATLNFILTPTSLAIGPSHDGATAGRESITLPLAGGSWWEAQASGAWQTLLAPNEVPFLEGVLAPPAPYDKPLPLLTQLRSGPAAPATRDFIPAPITVTNVVIAEGDLLKWEAKAKTFGPGTIIHHPGGSLLSHYAVHAILNRIPIVTSFEPRVGDTIELTTALPDYHLPAVVRGIEAGMQIPITGNSQGSAKFTPYAAAALLGFRHLAVLRGESGFFLGLAIALFHRMGIVACLGEARHAAKYTKTGVMRDRDAVYAEAFASVAQARLRLPEAATTFATVNWGMNSIGGAPWLACAKATVELDRELIAFLRDPSPAPFEALCGTLNRFVDLAHYNGWWLNKFTDETLFDWSLTGALLAVLPAIPVLWAATRLPRWEAIREWPDLPWADLLALTPRTKMPPHRAYLYLGAVGETEVTGVLKWQDSDSRCEAMTEITLPRELVEAEILTAAPHGYASVSNNAACIQYVARAVSDDSRVIFLHSAPEQVLRDLGDDIPWLSRSARETLQKTVHVHAIGGSETAAQPWHTETRIAWLKAMEEKLAGVPRPPRRKSRFCRNCEGVEGLLPYSCGEAICKRCCDAGDHLICTDCGIVLDPADTAYSPSGVDPYCEDCWREAYRTCENCEETYARTAITNGLCEDCLADTEEPEETEEPELEADVEADWDEEPAEEVA